jgi:hypothetical protein
MEYGQETPQKVRFLDFEKLSFLDPHDPHDRRGEEEGTEYG